jgi:DNA repair protein RadC
MFLNSQSGMIAFEVMFRVTLTQTSVYPREVVKRALELNCASCILVHNHPSGSLQPSRSDELLTKTMKDVLALIDVRVLDHIIISGERSQSMAELGLV